MKSLKQILAEAKLTHLEHVEDAIFDYGYEGGKEALRFLESVAETLHGNSTKSMNIQAKVDGAPAVICGINPENGKFFVGTKSLFNKNPKINYTNADVDKNHGHAKGLASKLKVALEHFPKIIKKGVYQGDFMFTPEDLTNETIDRQKYITFTPNTITYAVPVNSALAKTMKKAKAGVIWHTTYTGDTIADLSAQFKISLSSFTRNKSVWFSDTNFRDVSGTATMTKKEMSAFRNRVNNAHEELDKLDGKAMKLLFGKTEIAKNLKIYINSLVRNGKVYSGRQNAITGFIDFVTERLDKEVTKAKSEKGKASKQKVLDDLIHDLRGSNVAGTLAYALQWHDSVVDCKIMLVRKMEKVSQIPSFVMTSKGYKVTGPEGFVAIDKLSNSAVKLVDRMEFSANNFNAIKSWG